MTEIRCNNGLWTVPWLWKSRASGFPTATWKTPGVSHTPHSPDGQHGDISKELTMGTFLTSFDIQPFVRFPERGLVMYTATSAPGAFPER